MEFDAIIVGSGPAGATIARALSKKKQKVLILERGGNQRLREALLTTASILNTVSVNDDMAASRALTTGGTTALYFAVAEPPPLDIFRTLGIDMSRELEEAKRELPLALMPDELLGAQAIRVRESAMDLGYSWKKNTMLVDLSKCLSGYAYDAKWNARSYLRDAVDEGATLATRAEVIKVLVEKNVAFGVEYKLHKKRKTYEMCRAFGKKVVLAAGGAASPVILRHSGMRNVASRGFYCHPSFGVFGTVPGLKAGENFAANMGMVVEDDIGVGDGNPARAFYRMLMLGHGKFVRALFHSRSIGVGVMVKEGSGGALQEDGRYYKRLTQEDFRKLDKGEEIARQIIRHAGGKHIFKTPLSSAHIGGAIKIKEHIDENLQTEYANLYVCDGSVIPDTAKISPTLTLICLGKYLANHLSRIQ